MTSLKIVIFEDDEDDAVFDKSFMDPSCVGEQARLTMVYQVLKLWELPLLDKSTSSAQASDRRSEAKKKRHRS